MPAVDVILEWFDWGCSHVPNQQTTESISREVIDLGIQTAIDLAKSRIEWKENMHSNPS